MYIFYKYTFSEITVLVETWSPPLRVVTSIFLGFLSQISVIFNHRFIDFQSQESTAVRLG